MTILNDYLTENCLYQGRVFHYRGLPKKHHFKYKVFYLYFDIIETERTFRNMPFFSIDRFNLFSFYFKDHGPKNNDNLINWVKKVLKKNRISAKVSKIFLLTYPRYLGYVFNPLSVYTCLDKNKNVLAQIYEVHNTFGQRHFYLVKNAFDKKNHKKKIKKAFHVSPFMGMKGSYCFKSFSKKDKISIFINYSAENENLVASFTGRAEKLSNLNLLKKFFLLPLMTLKIISGIHFEALLLFLKGMKFYKCPKEKNSNLTN